jgi:hypothetical protein
MSARRRRQRGRRSGSAPAGPRQAAPHSARFCRPPFQRPCGPCRSPTARSASAPGTGHRRYGAPPSARSAHHQHVDNLLLLLDQLVRETLNTLAAVAHAHLGPLLRRRRHPRLTVTRRIRACAACTPVPPFHAFLAAASASIASSDVIMGARPMGVGPSRPCVSQRTGHSILVGRGGARRAARSHLHLNGRNDLLHGARPLLDLRSRQSG